MGDKRPAGTHADALRRRGEELFQAGDVEGALEAMEASVRADPSSALAWNDLGAVRHVLGRDGDAEAAFHSALEADGTCLDALVNLVSLHLERADLANAELRLAELERMAPHDPVVGELKGALAARGSPALARWRGARVTIVDWDRSGGAFHADLRQALARAGTVPAEAQRAVVELLAPSGGDGTGPAAVRGFGPFLDRVRPDAVVLERALEEAPALAEVCRASGVPVLTAGPDGDVPPAVGDELEASVLDALARAAGAPAPVWPPARPEPLVSVLAPTYDRHRCVVQFLEHLADQDLDPALFEVIVVDDGSPEPVREVLDGRTWPFSFTLLEQKNGGPARARNHGARHARGRWVLIFNDDAVPARDNVRRHLLAQAGTEVPTAVLGTFDFDEDACRDPFTDLMQNSTMLFEYERMQPGRLHDWRFFYTCNLSLPVEAFRAVGGFDEEFSWSINEDIELGYRLEKELEVKVLYDPRIRSWHDHDLDIDRYRRRNFLMGWFRVLMFRKHPELVTYFLGPSRTFSISDRLELRCKAELVRDDAERATAEIRELCGRMKGLDRRSSEYLALRGELAARVRLVGNHEIVRGYVGGAEGWGRELFDRRPRLVERPLSVVMPNLNGFPHVRAAIESLVEHTPPPYELIVVDNGSTDGSLEWLRGLDGVRLLEMGTNAGAPAARNRALEVAGGDTVLFCDNDVVFTPEWREILTGHLERWPDVGIVGPMSDYVSGHQRTPERPEGGESLDAFARRFHGKHAGRHVYAQRLILFFLLCRRELIDRIGGIDERFGRWGFEDDDFALRALLSGYRLRIARDCFVRHLGSQTARTAGIDYERLLRENWEVFKEKWRLDPSLPYGRLPALAEFERHDWAEEDLHVPIGTLQPVAE